ncbi:hypothetical protein JCM9157_873 [Halalkalibacter akibai JCM 9157]|uniref:Putative cysteine ligase BshC n=2 Tax=Halalkalibacter akibai TaxID=1411 RepID=W4QPK6_HALA3|nr:hypothetical protein JCM9157_873 [Halalkalibacter akibai JCM 9157]
MEVKEINLVGNNGFLYDYTNGIQTCNQFFDYTYTDELKYKARLDHLNTRIFHRAELADYFEQIHSTLTYAKEASIQIEKLRQLNSVVVVGGQQAGLLTGPLYTVYKAMSIILLAKQQEEELNIPVVPIFWVAGEDHDLDEIRYVYIERNTNWKKHMYHEPAVSSASNIKLNHEEMRKWLKGVYASLPETSHTNTLIDKVNVIVEQAKTITDFFKRMMNWFFGCEGLLLLDAHDPEIRKLEIPFFKELINNVEHVQEFQQQGARAFANCGYGEPVVTERENAHLFLEVKDERRRLDFQEGHFLVRGTDMVYSKEQLLQLLEAHPERFSNNVVTRPLMQEWLLPVLAFVSGPGEIKYWATIKEVFNHFHFKMPPVIPRIQMTVVPSRVNKWLKELNYDILPFMNGEMKSLRDSWLEEITPYPIEDVISKVKQDIEYHHAPLRQLAEEMDPTLRELSEKNLVILNNQIEFMERKMKNFHRQKHEQTLSKFTESGRWLAPLNRPQERVFHPILLMNVIGEVDLKRLLSTEMSLNDTHKIVYL